MPFAAMWMDLEIIILKWSKSDKEKHYMIPLICEIQKTMIQMNLFTKQKQTPRQGKQIYSYQRGNPKEFGINR